MLSSKPEAKDLTADELARRKDLENQLKLEFEVFVFGICEVFDNKIFLPVLNCGGDGCFRCCNACGLRFVYITNKEIMMFCVLRLNLRRM